MVMTMNCVYSFLNFISENAIGYAANAVSTSDRTQVMTATLKVFRYPMYTRLFVATILYASKVAPNV